MLGRKKRVILNDDEDIIEASNFADALTELCELNATVDMGYWDLLHLCNEINLFPFLFPEQKEVLMRRLYSPYCSYNSKVFAIITDRKDYRCVSKFSYFKIEGNKLIKYDFISNHLIDDYNDHLDLIKKYNFPQIKIPANIRKH